MFEKRIQQLADTARIDRANGAIRLRVESAKPIGLVPSANADGTPTSDPHLPALLTKPVPVPVACYPWEAKGLSNWERLDLFNAGISAWYKAGRPPHRVFSPSAYKLVAYTATHLRKPSGECPVCPDTCKCVCRKCHAPLRLVSYKPVQPSVGAPYKLANVRITRVLCKCAPVRVVEPVAAPVGNFARVRPRYAKGMEPQQ